MKIHCLKSPGCPGALFENDCAASSEWLCGNLNVEAISELLNYGHLVAWIQGRQEIGASTLGSRSLLAAPFCRAATKKLNGLRKAERAGAIASVGMAEGSWRRLGIPAVMKNENERLYALLLAFKKMTGIGVLCETSLHGMGCGFINKKSTLLDFAENADVCVIVISAQMLVREKKHPLAAPRRPAQNAG